MSLNDRLLGYTKVVPRILILAADISPMDIISHLPCLSEEHKIPYVFVASKEELGVASCTKRPTSCVMICPNMKRGKVKPKTTGDKMEEEDGEDDYRELYDEIREEVFAIVSLDWNYWARANQRNIHRTHMYRERNRVHRIESVQNV